MPMQSQSTGGILPPGSTMQGSRGMPPGMPPGAIRDVSGGGIPRSMLGRPALPGPPGAPGVRHSSSYSALDSINARNATSAPPQQQGMPIPPYAPGMQGPRPGMSAGRPMGPLTLPPPAGMPSQPAAAGDAGQGGRPRRKSGLLQFSHNSSSQDSGFFQKLDALANK